MLIPSCTAFQHTSNLQTLIFSGLWFNVWHGNMDFWALKLSVVVWPVGAVAGELTETCRSAAEGVNRVVEMSSTRSCFWNSWDIYTYILGYIIYINIYVSIYIYIYILLSSQCLKSGILTVGRLKYWELQFAPASISLTMPKSMVHFRENRSPSWGRHALSIVNCAFWQRKYFLGELKLTQLIEAIKSLIVRHNFNSTQCCYVSTVSLHLRWKTPVMFNSPKGTWRALRLWWSDSIWPCHLNKAFWWWQWGEWPWTVPETSRGRDQKCLRADETDLCGSGFLSQAWCDYSHGGDCSSNESHYR